MAKPIQLTLWPAAWWHNPELWRARKLASNIRRPTEEAAMDNLYYISRAAHRPDFMPQMTKLEKRVHNLDLRAHRKPHYSNANERATWVAERLFGKVNGPGQVLVILKNVSLVAREAERLHAASGKRIQKTPFQVTHAA